MSKAAVVGLCLATVLVGATVAWGQQTADAPAPNVVASIKPVHSLVAGVMNGVGAPELIVDGAGSPHSFSLKPSQARALEAAAIVFWVGPSLEAFLVKPLATLAANAQVVDLMSAPGVTLLETREGGAFEEHADEENHVDEDKHADKDNHADKDEHADDAAGAGGHSDEDRTRANHDDGHEDGHHDTHIWLDPDNAKAMVRAIEAALSRADPANAPRYAANAADLGARIDALARALEGLLQPVAKRPFVVFHDAYQYLERRFGLTAAGSITVHPETPPGAERVAAIRRKLHTLGAACVFSEPQFPGRLVDVITEGSAARSGVLDPLGSSLDDGPDLYFAMMRDMAGSVRDCLTPAS